MFKESTSTGKNYHVTGKNLEKEMIWLYMYISYLLIHLFQVDLSWKSIFYEILLMQEMRHGILLWKTRQQPMRMQQWLLPQFRPLTPPSMDTLLLVGIMHLYFLTFLSASSQFIQSMDELLSVDNMHLYFLTFSFASSDTINMKFFSYMQSVYILYSLPTNYCHQGKYMYLEFQKFEFCCIQLLGSKIKFLP